MFKRVKDWWFKVQWRRQLRRDKQAYDEQGFAIECEGMCGI
jgi:hypothetical protein